METTVTADSEVATWNRIPDREVRGDFTGKYRGFLLFVSTYGWHVSGQWQGYSVMASHTEHGDDRPSVEMNMAAAVAAARDLASKGWEPR